MRMRRRMKIGYVAVGAILLLLGWMSTVAQDNPIPAAFATNTPAAPFVFTTNTPLPAVPSPSALTPDAPSDDYGLRFWDEPALTTALLEQVRALLPGDVDRKIAIRLLQHELKQRFPGAPKAIEARAQLIEAMLDAPRGSVDMRSAIRPYIEFALNQVQPSFAGMSSFDYDGFNLNITAANIDGDERPDAILQIRYPALVNNPAELRYQDFVMARIDEQSGYEVLDADYPAAPLDNIQSLTLERIGDMNQDGVDEMAVSVERGEVNRELMIFGRRNESVATLVEPGARILFGEIVDWPLGGDAFTARELRLESAAWNCLGERDISWVYKLNFFRPPAEPDNFTFQSRLACLLYGSEPFFGQPAEAAISTIEAILPFGTPEDEASAQRAAMIVAMLRVLNGEPELALEQAQGLQAVAQPGTWLAEQTAVFLDLASQPNVTPVQLCAALEAASKFGVCSVEEVLTRLFEEQPLQRDAPIEAQLADLGITVLDSVTISEIGRVDRQAVHFVLAGDRWWAFAPAQKEVYTAEKIDPPLNFLLVMPPLPVVLPPQTAYDALLLQDDPAATLNILENALRDNPEVELAASGRFLQALSYELLGDRANARRTYFALWRDEPALVWGQLAAAHLEKR